MLHYTESLHPLDSVQAFWCLKTFTFSYFCSFWTVVFSVQLLFMGGMHVLINSALPILYLYTFTCLGNWIFYWHALVLAEISHTQWLTDMLNIVFMNWHDPSVHAHAQLNHLTGFTSLSCIRGCPTGLHTSLVPQCMHHTTFDPFFAHLLSISRFAPPRRKRICSQR